jgi:hypothetical protein
VPAISRGSRAGFALRHGVLVASKGRMTQDESWTIPLQVIMWTTMLVGFIMAVAVVLMH